MANQGLAMGQRCHWPPHPSSSSLPLSSHSLTTSPQAGRGGARPALLSTTAPGLGAWAGQSMASSIRMRSAEPLTTACLLFSHTGFLRPFQQPQKFGNAESMLPRGKQVQRREVTCPGIVELEPLPLDLGPYPVSAPTTQINNQWGRRASGR